MKTHIVKPGECIGTIAIRYGFRNWQTIYEAAENKEFKKRRPNPNVIFEGDEIVIPNKGQKSEFCLTEQKHTFRVSITKWLFRMEMRDDELNPLDGEPFELHIDGVLVCRDTTGAEGLIEVPIDACARTGTLVFMGEDIELHFGGLDPTTRVTGIQQRLRNLGYQAGAVDGSPRARTASAVAAFQADRGMEVTGRIDDDVRRELLKLHDNDDELREAEEEMTQPE